MSDTAQKIKEIREALEKATPGPWKWVDVYKKNDFEKYNMGGFVNEEGKLICHFGNRINYYPTEGEPPDYDDELLIANAPEWLRFLLDELDSLRESLAEWVGDFEALRQDRDRLRQERDKLIEGLRWYADKTNYVQEVHHFWHGTLIEPAEAIYYDGGQRARDILREVGVTTDA